MKLTLYRSPSGEFGTFGMMFHGAIPLCNTLEDPWRENRPNVSCIPAGTYKCSPHSGIKFKGVWVLHNVSGRSAILIHGGNTHLNTEGCILVGSGLGVVEGLPAVTNSRPALEMLRRTLPDKFDIEIRNFTPQVFVQPPKLSWFEGLFKKGD